MRGDVVRLGAARDARGHEQRGSRYAVIVQNDALPLSTLVVVPTSTAARAASFRPEVTIGGVATRVLTEQIAAVDPTRLGDIVGHLTRSELEAVESALRTVIGLEE